MARYSLVYIALCKKITVWNIPRKTFKKACSQIVKFFAQGSLYT